MRLMVRIEVCELGEYGYSVGKAGRSEVEISGEVFNCMARDLARGEERGRKKDRDRVAVGLGDLVQALVNVYEIGVEMVGPRWREGIPVLPELARKLVGGPRGGH